MTRLVSLVLFYWLTFAIAVKSAYTPCDICLERASPAQLANIKLRLYTGPTMENPTSVRIGDALQLFDKIDNSKPTALYTFGYIGTENIPSTRAVIQAYLDRKDHNILLLDWHEISVNRPIFAIRSVEGIGYYLAMALNQLVARGLNTTGLNIIGHSLGGQICGFCGKNVNITLPRITGLDPAGPGFTFTRERLNSTDAEFVAIIHTNRGGLGIDRDTGTVHFNPNSGYSPQPGCGIDIGICSHYRSVYFYAESVRTENSFIGRVCDSWSDFEAGLCDSNETVVMGYATPTSARGKVYLRTNSNPPYGLGEEGSMS